MLLAAACLAGCGYLHRADGDETEKFTENQLFDAARAELAKENWNKATLYYQRFEIRYPYSKYTQQAMLDNAYAYYKSGQQELALAELDRFIKLYPNQPRLDYAYYLKALCAFNGDLGLLGNFSGQDPTERDPKTIREAFDSYREVVTRFPNSPYAEDSRQRMTYIVNALASHEVHAARYYMKRGAYVAAANRIQYSLKEFPLAPANEEGLLILVKSYDALGMNDLRDDAERVMKVNFPNSRYLTGDVPDGKGHRWWQLWNE